MTVVLVVAVAAWLLLVFVLSSDAFICDVLRCVESCCVMSQACSVLRCVVVLFCVAFDWFIWLQVFTCRRPVDVVRAV